MTAVGRRLFLRLSGWTAALTVVAHHKPVYKTGGRPRAAVAQPLLLALHRPLP